MSNLLKPFYEIKKLKEFLEKSLKTQILDYNLRSFTQLGDNYGSIIQALEVKVKNIDSVDKEKLLQFVCKSVVTNPYLIEIFQPEILFVKEAQFYLKIIPTIERFENDMNIPDENRLDAFIKCIGARISLDSDVEHADLDALIVLENVKIENFKNENRQIGFDTETANVILKQLAQFHALCIAIRRLEPEVYNENIRPYLTKVKLIGNVDDICNELSLLKHLDPKLRITLENQLRFCDQWTQSEERVTDTPYTTVVLRDLWATNIMVLRDQNKKPTKVKIYDFQLYVYQTFVCDLIFFLFTNVRSDDLQKKFHLFIQIYYDQFIHTLKLINFSTDDYTFDKMWQEIKSKAKLELLHVMFMTKVCRADVSNLPTLDELTSDTFIICKTPAQNVLDRWTCIIDLFTKNGFI